MRHIEFRRIVTPGILALALLVTGAVSPSFAQVVQDPDVAPLVDDDRDDDMDWGWLGLLGLAGLLGLKRRDSDHHVDTTRTRV